MRGATRFASVHSGLNGLKGLRLLTCQMGLSISALGDTGVDRVRRSRSSQPPGVLQSLQACSLRHAFLLGSMHVRFCVACCNPLCDSIRHAFACVHGVMVRVIKWG